MGFLQSCGNCRHGAPPTTRTQGSGRYHTWRSLASNCVAAEMQESEPNPRTTAWRPDYLSRPESDPEGHHGRVRALAKLEDTSWRGGLAALILSSRESVSLSNADAYQDCEQEQARRSFPARHVQHRFGKDCGGLGSHPGCLAKSPPGSYDKGDLRIHSAASPCRLKECKTRSYKESLGGFHIQLTRAKPYT